MLVCRRAQHERTNCASHTCLRQEEPRSGARARAYAGALARTRAHMPCVHPQRLAYSEGHAGTGVGRQTMHAAMSLGYYGPCTGGLRKVCGKRATHFLGFS